MRVCDRGGQEAGVVVRGTWCLVFIVRGTGRRWRIAGGGGTRGEMVSLHPVPRLGTGV